jgi:hypothetical protein
MLRLIEDKHKDDATLERLLTYLKEAKAFIAISIQEDGMPQEHYFNVTPEQRIWLCELAKHSAIEDYKG